MLTIDARYFQIDINSSIKQNLNWGEGSEMATLHKLGKLSLLGHRIVLILEKLKHPIFVKFQNSKLVIALVLSVKQNSQTKKEICEYKKLIYY